MTFEQANKFIYTDYVVTEKEALEAFNIKRFEGICVKCDRRSRCLVNNKESVMNCNFFEVLHK